MIVGMLRIFIFVLLNMSNVHSNTNSNSLKLPLILLTVNILLATSNFDRQTKRDCFVHLLLYSYLSFG